jgi:hypothetical protein
LLEDSNGRFECGRVPELLLDGKELGRARGLCLLTTKSRCCFRDDDSAQCCNDGMRRSWDRLESQNCASHVEAWRGGKATHTLASENLQPRIRRHFRTSVSRGTIRGGMEQWSCWRRQGVDDVACGKYPLRGYTSQCCGRSRPAGDGESFISKL